MNLRNADLHREIAFSLAVAMLCCMASTADADTPAAKPAGCTAAAHHQFDFWLGDWDVTDGKGKVAGRNRIVSLHDGCVLQESWSGAGGFTGTSLNAYDADRKAWHQTWVDNNGGVLQLDGTFADGKMILAGASLDDGKQVLQRITWERLPDGRVRQLWESSKNNGTTWTVAFDGYYAKR
jgi:hypothetical protein